MSELEYQVCILVKLRIAPKDIAAVLARDVSTISTVRSRLYQKVFSKKGGAKEWDEFILSI
jgi:DNA-binding CsgD family transcriptional regulator